MSAEKPKILITDREVYLNEEQLAELRGRAEVVQPEQWDEATLIEEFDKLEKGE